MSAFQRAFELTLEAEGGDVDDPQDPGGRTRFGISQRAYPDEDISRLTLARAQFLYRRDYWDKINADALPEAVAIAVFDYAVNSGVSQATRALQRVLGVTSDGVIGPKTLAVLRQLPSRLVVAMLSADRLVYVAGLPTFARFGRGWARRTVTIAMEAVS